MIVVSYGGGTDSTALLIEAHNRGIRPDLILFADTGSEMPHTYAYLPVIGEWLARVGFPEIQVVRWIRRDGRFVALHDNCLERGELPSKAYGYAGCTSKWKHHPLDSTVKNHSDVIAALVRGEVVERWLGYDATEGGRVANIAHKPPPFKWRAPLYDWDIAREDCRRIITGAGLPQPGKSACWMCPMMRGHEIDALNKQYPHLMELALKMEEAGMKNGSGDTVGRGLGMNTPGRVSWKTWVSRPEQMSITGWADDDNESMPCGCHD